MSKKTSVKKTALTGPNRTGRPVRLDLSEADHVRLEHAAKARGLGKAAYARQAVLMAIAADESKDR